MWVLDTCVVLDVFENDPSFGFGFSPMPRETDSGRLVRFAGPDFLIGAFCPEPRRIGHTHES